MGEFLKSALTPFANDFRWQGHGILEWVPQESRTPTGEIFVISAGIHGNETAPVELLDQLVENFRLLQDGAAAPCLFILGNIEAMQAQKRFIGTNLNRLFTIESESPACSIDHSPASFEQQRAKMLQLAVRCFSARYPGCAMVHLDLHTAIGRSEITQFALLPPSTGASSQSLNSDLLKTLLQAAGMAGCVRHQESGSTFSGWTARAFGALSATLELGQVKSFGDNDLTLLKALEETLHICCSAHARQGRPVRDAIDTCSGDQDMINFVVHHEIIRKTDDFVLHLPQDIANFQRIPHGASVYSDGGGNYILDHPQARILFPNQNVETGHRAGLIVVPA